MGEAVRQPETVLLVGHCAADTGMLRQWLLRHFQVEIATCDSIADAIVRLQTGRIDLLLINRIFEFTGERGIDLLQQLPGTNRQRPVPAMLISNYADAQKAAVEAGGLAGFGKSELHAPRAIDAVRAALATGATQIARNPD